MHFKWLLEKNVIQLVWYFKVKHEAICQQALLADPLPIKLEVLIHAALAGDHQTAATANRYSESWGPAALPRLAFLFTSLAANIVTANWSAINGAAASDGVFKLDTHPDKELISVVCSALRHCDLSDWQLLFKQLQLRLLVGPDHLFKVTFVGGKCCWWVWIAKTKLYLYLALQISEKIMRSRS